MFAYRHLTQAGLRALVFVKRRITRPAVSGYRALNRVINGARTIGAAAAVLNRQNEIVLVRLVYRTGWGLPGGFSHRRETPEQTVAREVYEETGISIRTTESPRRVVLDKNHKHLTFAYLAQSDAPIRRPKKLLDRIEVLEARRFPLKDLPRLHKGTEDILSTLDLPRLQEKRLDLDR